MPDVYSMRDLNEDSSSSSWPIFYADNTLPNGQNCNGYMPRNSINGYPGHEKEALKQKMLEHEAVFKNQVSELHRLYKVQRDMMEEVKRKELHKHRGSIEPASSSSLQGSQVRSEENRKWHMAGFSLLNSSYGKTPTSEIEVVKSPMRDAKGSSTQTGQFPFQNGSTSKDVEIMDARPSKARKKLFDLHLPAEEYIDTEEGEKLSENKVSNIAVYPCNGHPSSRPENSVKLVLDNHVGVRTDCRINASASSSCLRGSVGLADLNDPIQIDEEMAPPSVDFLGHTSQNEEARDISQPTKPNAGYSLFENKVNVAGQFLHMHEAGSSWSNPISVSQGHPPVTMPPPPSLPMKGILNQFRHPSGTYSPGYSGEGRWKQGPHHSLDFSDKNSRDCLSNNHLGSTTTRPPGSYAFSSSPYVGNSRDQSILSWPKPTSSFAQNVLPLEASWNSAAAMIRSFQPSTQSQEPFGAQWQVNSSSRLNSGLRNESKENGFFVGSTSGSKGPQVDLTSVSTNYLNYNRGDDLAPNRSTNHVFRNFSKGSCRTDLKPAIDINLNEVSKSSSDGVVILQDLNETDEKSKPEGHLAALPWLRPKPTLVKEGADCHKNVNVRYLNRHFCSAGTLDLNDCENEQKREIAESKRVKKLLGFPVFETGATANEPSSSLAATSESVDGHPDMKNSTNGRQKRMIDINVACEQDQVTADEVLADKEEQGKSARVRDFIDLNSCASDCKEPMLPCSERKPASVRTTLEIDLEAPASLENDDDYTPTEWNIPTDVSVPSVENKSEQIQDEVLKDAAEILVAVSSLSPQVHKDDSTCLLSNPSLDKSLLWFADAMDLLKNELDNTSGRESRLKNGVLPGNSTEEVELDEYEAMTLQLTETKEEDYMPGPFVPEVQIIDDPGSSVLPSRPRRGQSRRGRPRRDFQRDILPGLTSLSRHEVTEDIQGFAGIMRAHGHSWNSGLTRRNGTKVGARGRRRAVAEPIPTTIPNPANVPLMQQFANIEAGLEDRSLMGWGRTTRRPRRQRYPAGNPPIALT